MAAASHWEPNCPHSSPHSHNYGLSWPSWKSRTATWHSTEVPPFSGSATVWDGNVIDCDDDYDPFTQTGETADFDGDYETGEGGGFFGYGPWAHEPTCDYGLTSHSGTVTVNDAVFGNDIWFIIGADQTAGPWISVDPIDGSITCNTDGHIEPCDPVNPSPTCGPSDCLTPAYLGSGSTCGAGGDGGYWVFLLTGHIWFGPGGTGVGNPPTLGTITA